MDNLEKSEVVISRILNLLMERGLQASDLDFEELELEPEYFAFFISCADWLAKEGLIRADEIVRTLNGGGFLINPVLTSYGLSTLGRRLSNKDDSDLVSTAVKEVASSKRSYSQAGDFVGGLLGGLTKALGS